MIPIGVPTVAVAIIENQLYNIHGWEKAGFIEYAGWWENSNALKNIVTSVNRLRTPAVREARLYIGRKFVDGKGAIRIAEYFS